MKISEVKERVKRGETVHYRTKANTVHRDTYGNYYIVAQASRNGYVKLGNQKLDLFFIGEN